MLKKYADIFSRFATGDMASLLLALFVYACVVLEIPVFGIAFLSGYVFLLCLSTFDVLPMIQPLLSIYCLTFFCPDATFLVFLGIPVGLSFFYRLFRNRRFARPGPAFFGLLATTAALLLAGLGHVGAAEYFSPAVLYITLGLGPMLICLYLFFRSSLVQGRDYAVADYVCRAFYIIAVLIAFLLLRVFLTHPEILAGRDHVVHKLEALAPWRNGAANLAVMLLPFVFYFVKKNGPIHLLAAFFIYISVALSGARAALILGGLVLLFGAFWYAAGHRILRIVLPLCLVLCLGLALVFIQPILAFAQDFLCIDVTDYDFREETRYRLLLRAWEDFLHNPLFGCGMAGQGNAAIFQDAGSPGTGDLFRVYWYHSLLPQIGGSMGIIGLLAYGYQFVLRLRAIARARRTAYTFVLAFAYVGILLYSMLDPGIFSPMPFAVLTTMIIVMLEAEENKKDA